MIPILLALAAEASPPGALQLAVVSGVPVGGSTVTFGVRGAEAGALVVLAFSDGVAADDAGLCPPPLGGDCLDFAPGPLGTPFVTSQADGAGEARFTVVLPAVPPATDFTLQAVALGAAPDTSNVLSLAIPRCGHDAFEPNDDRAGAGPLLPALDAEVCSPVDEDWFVFEVAPLAFLEVAGSYDPAEADVDLSLTDAAGVILDLSQRNDGTEQLSWFNATHDPVSVYVRAYAFFDPDGDGASYALTSESAPASECYEEASEPNDDWSDAVPLALGTPYAAQACEVDPDWYSFQVRDGDVVLVALGVDDAHGEVGLRLYDRNLTRISAGDDTVSYVSPIDQTLYAAAQLIADDPLGGGNAYHVTATVPDEVTCPNDAFEPNETLVEAAEVALGRYDDLGACVGDSDWYRITLDPGSPLVVDLHFPHVDGNVDVRVYGPDGALLGEGRRTGTDDEHVVIPEVVDPGDHVIEVWLVAEGAGPTVSGVGYALELSR